MNAPLFHLELVLSLPYPSHLCHYLSLHRLVQAVLKDAISAETQRDWTQRAIRAINAAFPNVEFETWPQCDRLLPHALLCAELIVQDEMTAPEGARLLNKVGWYLADRARYVEAEPLYERALSIYEQQLGAQHPDTATSLIHLASLYEKQGKYKQTEPLVVRALAIDEKVYGAEHLEVAADLAHLGYLYQVQGKSSENNREQRGWRGEKGKKEERMHAIA